MADDFRSIDQPPEEFPAGMTAADFASDEGAQSRPGMEPGFGMPTEPGTEPGPGPGEEPKPSGQDKLKAFIGTSKGKAIAIGGIVAFLAILGIVAFFVVTVVLAPPTAEPPAVTGVTTPGGSVAGTSTAGPSAATSGTAALQGEDTGLPDALEVFENKDPFRPLIIQVEESEAGTTVEVSSEPSPTVTETSESGSTSSGGTSSSSSSGGSSSTTSLTLKSISYSGGEWVAVVVYGGKSYTVRAGDQVANSPWKVLSITSSSMTVQYGDEQVTLTLA